MTNWLARVAAALLLLSARMGAGSSQKPTDPPCKGVELIALAPAERLAVLRLPDEALALLGPGEALPGTACVLREVLAGKLVLDESLASGRRIVWLQPAARPGGPQRVRILDPRPPSTPPLARPLVAPAVPNPDAKVTSRGPGG